MELLFTLAISVGINIAMFIPAYMFKTDKLTDISYALTFVVVAGYGLAVGGVTTATVVLFSMILIWAMRLGGYLLYRIHKMGRDKRFDERRESFVKFGSFWLLQGISVWVVLIPSIFFFLGAPGRISTYAYIGIAVWAAGLIIESLADWQKFVFIQNPENKGRWIESGLWRYSRHPNYFGEITVWTGVYVFTLFGLSLTETIIGAVGPLYIASLIIFISGIPLLEKSADKRWGDNENYRQYKKSTSVLVPLPKKKLNHEN